MNIIIYFLRPIAVTSIIFMEPNQIDDETREGRGVATTLREGWILEKCGVHKSPSALAGGYNTQELCRQFMNTYVFRVCICEFA